MPLFEDAPLTVPVKLRPRLVSQGVIIESALQPVIFVEANVMKSTKFVPMSMNIIIDLWTIPLPLKTSVTAQHVILPAKSFDR